MNPYIQINNFLKPKLIGRNFKKADDNYTYILEIDKNKSFLICIIDQGGFFHIKYGIRPNLILEKLSILFKRFVLPPMENPFSKKWCALFWDDLIDNDLINTDSLSSENFLINSTEINYNFEKSVEKHILNCRQKSINYFLEYSWTNEFFDGLSKYIMPASALNENLFYLAEKMEDYFISRQPSDKIDDYTEKLRAIENYFGHI